MASDRPTAFIYVQIPEQLDAGDRETRYGDPLDGALTMAGVGFVSGGGTLFEAPDEDGASEIIYCGVDVDVYDLEAGLSLLREQLVELGCPQDTRLIYADDSREDVFDGRSWRIGMMSQHLQ